MDHLVSHLEHPDQHNNNVTKLYSQLDTQLKIQLLEQALIGSKKLRIQKDRQSNVRERMDRDVTLSNEMMYNNLSREDECPLFPRPTGFTTLRITMVLFLLFIRHKTRYLHLNHQHLS
jgi:hypothetical protein